MAIRSLKIQTETIRRARAKKKREKERKRRRIQKFGHTELKHAKRGKTSCKLAFFSMALMILLFSISYISKGEINILFGFVGILAFGLSALGMYRGYEGLRERNKNYITCKIGMVCNGFLLLGYIATFVRGLV